MDTCALLVEEHLINGHIKGGNHFLWIVDELSVEISVKVFEVFAIEVQERLADEINLNTRNSHLNFVFTQ